MKLLSVLFVAGLFAAPQAALALDHGPFDALLKANVKADTVNYAGFVDNASFKAYVAAVMATDPTKLPDDKARLAFWINAYNAFTITAVLKHWPKITSVSAVAPDFGFFKQKEFKVGERPVSLNDIENEIIRPTFKDPRIHAAVNCASVSCPPLQPFAFTAKDLDTQLEGAMKAFVNDRARNAIDAKTGAVKLSQIFNWYKADFEAKGGVKAYLAGYLTDPAEKAAVEKAATLEFLEYDWNLNKSK